MTLATTLTVALCEQIVPQDDIPNSFPEELAEDCVDPKAFKRLAGFDSTGYKTQALPVPRAVANASL